MFRVISKADWNDGIWHVLAEWPTPGIWTPVFEPRNGDDLMDVWDCLDWVREQERKENV